MAFTVRATVSRTGDYLANAHILSADFGFGCAGNNQSPHLAWSVTHHRHLGFRPHLHRFAQILKKEQANLLQTRLKARGA
jgi:hypothetical protein